MHLREGDDALRRVFDLPEIEPQVAPLHQAGERRPVLGADHDLDLQAGGRGHEIVSAIGSARDQQQDADHLYKLTTNRMTPMPPAISVAAHGGFVDLLEVRGGAAYVQLGGGCQGCAQVDVTLRQGIEVAIKAAVPQITEVIDVTDHAAGTNPYFQPAKKAS